MKKRCAYFHIRCPKYIRIPSDIYIKDYVESLCYCAEFYYYIHMNTSGDALS